MIRHVIFTAALGLTTVSAAMAAETPKNAEACMQQVYELATSAQKRKLSDAKLNEIEGLLTKMENHCGADELAEAAKVHDAIAAAISK